MHRDRAADLTLVAAGPALWAVHLLAMYGLVPWACRHGGAGVALLVALTVAAAAGAAAAATTAHRRGRGRGRGRGRHVVAMALAAGFGFAVVLHGLVALVVDPCA